MNLRLSGEAAAALRAAAERSGRSQQDLLREAVDRLLGLHSNGTDRDRAIQAGIVEPPSAFRDVIASVELRDDRTTLDLLDRDRER